VRRIEDTLGVTVVPLAQGSLLLSFFGRGDIQALPSVLRDEARRALHLVQTSPRAIEIVRRFLERQAGGGARPHLSDREIPDALAAAIRAARVHAVFIGHVQTHESVHSLLPDQARLHQQAAPHRQVKSASPAPTATPAPPAPAPGRIGAPTLVPSAAKPGPTAQDDFNPDWNYEQRFGDVVRRAEPKLEGDLRAGLRSLKDHIASVITGALFFMAALSVATDGALDAPIFLYIAIRYGGAAAISAIENTKTFVTSFIQAKSGRDLDRAADALVAIIKAIGVIGFLAILHRVAKADRPGGGGSGEGDVAPEGGTGDAVPRPPPAAPKPAPQPVEPKPPQTQPAPEPAAQQKPVWSATKKLTAEQNAAIHAEKHAAEFPELDEGEYVGAAQDFVSNPPADCLTKARGDDTLIYQPSTNTFGVRAPDGSPRTMFRPDDGINYWNKQ
jgi:hypothetical protein